LQSRFLNSSRIDTASAEPSTGSVPEQSSSSIISDFSSAVRRILAIFVICDENVDRLCSMLCSSPISTYSSSNIPITLFSLAGIIIPHIAISTSKPAVLRETVLPPVFGPVTISDE